MSKATVTAAVQTW